MEGLLKYFIECLHFHFYLFARKKQNVTCGRPFNRQKTTEICHFFVSTFWCLQLDKPTLGARGFFCFCFVLDRGFAAHCRRKTKQKNPSGTQGRIHQERSPSSRRYASCFAMIYNIKQLSKNNTLIILT